MEFSFDVDNLFPDTVTKITGGRYERYGISMREATFSADAPPRERGVTNNEWLKEVVEKMGQASARVSSSICKFAKTKFGLFRAGSRSSQPHNHFLEVETEQGDAVHSEGLHGKVK